MCRSRAILSLAAVSVGLVASAFSTTSQAAVVYYLQASTGNTDWTTNTAVWWDQTSGGNHPANAAALAGSDFDLNGFIITATSGVNTFPGASLKLNGGGVRIRNNTTVTNATATGGSVLFSQDVSGYGFSFTNFTNSSGTTRLEVDGGAGAANITFNFTTLTGAGDFALNTLAGGGYATNKTLILTATTASAWTGNMSWLADTSSLPATTPNDLSLQFGANAVFGGSLTVPSNGRITLDKDVTFASVTLNGVQLAAGTHSFAELNSDYNTIFNEGGSGSIQVVPEPATLGLAGLIGLGLAARRRRPA